MIWVESKNFCGRACSESFLLQDARSTLFRSVFATHQVDDLIFEGNKPLDFHTIVQMGMYRSEINFF